MSKSDANHFSELFFTSRLKPNVREAIMRYQLYLKEQKKFHAESDKARKRKAVEDEIRDVECKRSY